MDERNQRTALYVVSGLLVLAIIGVVILWVRNSRLAEQRDQALAQAGTTVTQLEQRDRDAQELQSTIQQLRSERAELETQLNEEIQQREQRLQQSQRRVAGMQGNLEDLREQNQDLQDQLLTMESNYQSALEELEQARGQLQTQETIGVAVSDSIAMARPLQVYNIFPLNKWNRWIFSDQYHVERARRVDETHIFFEVAGTVFSPQGEREVHFVMRDPYGEVINREGQEFDNQEIGAPEAYTRQTTVNFTTEPIPVSFIIEHQERLEPGVYQLEVFIDGRLARTATMNLE